MQQYIRVLNGTVTAAVACVILMSTYPGYLAGFACLSVPLFPILAIAWFHLLAISSFPKSPNFRAVSPVQLAAAPVVVCIALVVLYFYFPLRIAFSLSEGEFAKFLPTAAQYDEDGVPVGRRFGLYYVDRCATTDFYGGVFFRTGLSRSGLFGMDEDSYGFVYRPNKTHTPYGRSNYRLFPLGNEWYCFEVTDRF